MLPRALAAAAALACFPALAYAGTTASVTLTPGPLTVSTPTLGAPAAAHGGWVVAVRHLTVVNATGSLAGWHLQAYARDSADDNVSLALPSSVDVYDHGDVANAASASASAQISGGYTLVAYARRGLGTFTFPGAQLTVSGTGKPSGLHLYLTVISGP